MNERVAGQYLTFEVAGDEYGLPILRVREILRYEALTRVPGMPACVRGVCNLRGQVVPVIDLGVKLGLGESRVDKWTCIVMAEAAHDGETSLMGVLADSVRQVLQLAPGDVEPPPSFGTRVRVEHLLGMGRLDRRFVLLLDLDRLLSLEELLSVTSSRGATSEGESAA